jgi:hypothetical protein
MRSQLQKTKPPFRLLPNMKNRLFACASLASAVLAGCVLLGWVATFFGAEKYSLTLTLHHPRTGTEYTLAVSFYDLLLPLAILPLLRAGRLLFRGAATSLHGDRLSLGKYA